MVPHALVQFRPAHALARRAEDGNDFVHELPELPAPRAGVVAEQIEDLPAAVAVLVAQRGHFEAALKVDVARLMRLRDEHHVEVPRDRHPAVVRAVVKEMVFVRSHIHVADEAVQRVKAVVGGQVQIRAPPVFIRPAPRLIHETVHVAVAFVLPGGLVLFVGAAGHAVDVSIGEIALVEKGAIGIFDQRVKPPEVARVLIFGRLLRAVDDAELHVTALRAGHARDFVRAKRKRLVEPGHASIALHPRTRARVHRERIHRARFLVVGLFRDHELPRRVELEAPFVFSADVRAALPAIGKSDVVIDFPIGHERAGEVLFVRVGVPLAFLHIVARGEQRHRRQSGEKGGGKNQRHALARRAGKAGPLGKSREAEVGKVGTGVVGVGHAHRLTARILGGNTVADEPAMLLEGGGELRGKDAVARAGVSVLALVAHRDGRPVFLKGRVAFADVLPGIDDLVVQRHAFHPACGHNARGQPHELRRLWLQRRVTDGADARRRHIRGGGIALARRGFANLRFARHESRTAPRTARQAVHRGIHQFE